MVVVFARCLDKAGATLKSCAVQITGAIEREPARWLSPGTGVIEVVKNVEGIAPAPAPEPAPAPAE